MRYIAGCQALPLSSRGTFAFQAGSYSFNIRADQVADPNGGAATFGVNMTPSVAREPATLGVVGTGLLVLGGHLIRWGPRSRAPSA